MVNYANCKIYKLVLKGGDELNDMYIGSTCTPLCKRMDSHRSFARNGKPAKVYQWMCDVGIENVEIILIANCPCENFEEQRKHERRYVDELQPSLNVKNPYTSRNDRLKQVREYRACNKEHFSDLRRKCYERNKAHILQYQRDYREKNKAKILNRDKQYRYNNKERMAVKSRVYFECNKDAINARRRQRRLEKKLLGQAEQSSQLDTNVN